MLMPHANIWIRKEDYELWDAIEKKSDWLHNRLNDIKINQVLPPVKIKPEVPPINPTYALDCPRHHVPKTDCAHQH